ncbi:hypothetical protein Esti_000154 [Eimeria stiedai]
MASSGQEPTWKLLYGESPIFIKPETRVYMNHIPSRLTEEAFSQRLQKMYGPVQIHCFVHGDHNDGFAWVGFHKEEAAKKAVEASSPQLAPKEAPEVAEAKEPIREEAEGQKD